MRRRRRRVGKQRRWRPRAGKWRRRRLCPTRRLGGSAASVTRRPGGVYHAALLRLLLVALGEWQDAYLEVCYTDADYLVFSDAATSVAAGGSPFACATYCYSPLLAFLLLLPSSLLHPAWGKILFSTAARAKVRLGCSILSILAWRP